MKRAFSLVELLVVIAIIAVLAGVLLATFGGGTDSARAARCLSNMKNLANACQTYGMANHRYPNAGSVEILSLDESNGRGQVHKKYTERTGWISWNSEKKYPTTSHTANSTIGMFTKDDKESAYALTNGCLWKLVSQNRQTYICPSHAKKLGKKGKVSWSYLMNAYFGWDISKGSRACSQDGGYHVGYGDLASADRRLLFSEVPFMGWSSWQPEGNGGSQETDGILNYPIDGLESRYEREKRMSPGGNETIGANHMIGKILYAHVAYADGHCEKLRIPYKGSSKKPQIDESNLKNLTTWLCAGIDVSYSSSGYKKLDSAE